jgi:hypothetical protein
VNTAVDNEYRVILSMVTNHPNERAVASVCFMMLRGYTVPSMGYWHLVVRLHV